MKEIIGFALLVAFSISAWGQAPPKGMQYQAIARNLNGEVIPNRDVSLRVSLFSGQLKNSRVHYKEIQQVKTNQFGLFTMVIGNGMSELGAFTDVPWSSEEIWMEVAVKESESANFITISNSKLLTVPYAFHAGTANALTGNTASNSQDQLLKKKKEIEVCDCKDGLSVIQLLYLGQSDVTINIYEDKNLKKLFSTFTLVQNGGIFYIFANPEKKKLPDPLYVQIANSAIPVIELPAGCKDEIVGETFGNYSVISKADGKNGTTCSVCDIDQEWKVGGNVVFDFCNWLGTKNKSDLVVITDNTERMRISKNGNVEIQKNLKVNGTVDVESAFRVNNQSPSTLSGSLTVKGITDLQNTLDVTGATHLQSSLTTEGPTALKNSLTTDGTTVLKGTLTTDGATFLKSTLSVAYATDLLSTLRVGNTSQFLENAQFEKDVTIKGGLTTNGLSINSNNANFVASFINQNGGTGDGIQIKLGKTHPAWTGAAYVNVSAPSEIFTNAITTIKGWVYEHKPASPSQLLQFIPVTYQAGLACNVVNMITDRLNTALGLEVNIPDVKVPAVVLPKLTLGEVTIIGQTTLLEAQTLLKGFTLIPKIPTIDCAALGLPTFSVPNITFIDVENSLTNENQFLQFIDKDNRELGSVKAQSVLDFRADYLDGTFFVKMMAGMVGVDVVNGVANAIAGFTEMAKAFNKLGVEYSSGHGDYAEWLERINPNEMITPGDIVGVRGGKISKNLYRAEQLLVVSKNPIILGNSPSAEKEKDGNKIAFMGQVPVKIMGPVTAGDYIIASDGLDGYGVAVHPADLSLRDAGLTVGRSWDTNLNEGPKLVNTIVGVDNGNLFSILQKNTEHTAALEARIRSLEIKMRTLDTKKPKSNTRGVIKEVKPKAL